MQYTESLPTDSLSILYLPDIMINKTFLSAKNKDAFQRFNILWNYLEYILNDHFYDKSIFWAYLTLFEI